MPYGMSWHFVPRRFGRIKQPYKIKEEIKKTLGVSIIVEPDRFRTYFFGLINPHNEVWVKGDYLDIDPLEIRRIIEMCGYRDYPK